MACTLLIVCLWLQQTYVAYDEDRGCEFHGEQTPLENERLMLSWSVLVIVMFCITMFAGIMRSSVVDAWRLCKAEASETTRTEVHDRKRHDHVPTSHATGAGRVSTRFAISNLRTTSCSHAKGRYYMLKGVVMEIVEVFTQTSRCFRFRTKDPWSGSSGFR